MSKFEVKVRRVNAIEPHSKADRLEFVAIDGYRALVRKGQYKLGDLVVYLPEAAVTTPFILQTVGLWDNERQEGKCAGNGGMRIKALRLRGSLSQGLVYPLQHCPGHTVPGWYLEDEHNSIHRVEEGQDVADLLGVRKYKPEIPEDLDGLVFDAGIEIMPRFDVEDIKKFPDVLRDGELVRMTEKLHGTFSVFLLLPPEHAHPVHGDFVVSSKGLSEQGLAFQNCADNQGNAYIRAAATLQVYSKMVLLRASLAAAGHDVSVPVVLLGEVLGSASQQDLKYGEKLALAVFDIGLGWRSSLQFFAPAEVEKLAAGLGLRTAPVVYEGPFSREALTHHTAGTETFSGKGLHLREGVVVRPLVERRDAELGRVLLKSVSEDYLLRGGAATEYS